MFIRLLLISVLVLTFIKGDFILTIEDIQASGENKAILTCSMNNTLSGEVSNFTEVISKKGIGTDTTNKIISIKAAEGFILQEE